MTSTETNTEHIHDNDCLFCKIIKKEIPCYKLYETQNIIVFLNIFPTNHGHVLIIPKTHAKTIFEIEQNTLIEITKQSKIIASNLKEKLNCGGVSIIQNNNKAAEQDISHYHMHIIPRYDDDGMNINYNEQKEMLTSNEALEILMKIS